MLLGFQEQGIDSFSVCGNMPANRIWIDIYIIDYVYITFIMTLDDMIIWIYQECIDNKVNVTTVRLCAVMCA